jgi:hypothetical protein
MFMSKCELLVFLMVSVHLFPVDLVCCSCLCYTGLFRAFEWMFRICQWMFRFVFLPTGMQFYFSQLLYVQVPVSVRNNVNVTLLITRMFIYD